ncbi:VOC family protein [Streptomyces longispororuber]|uniref:VOC family protein n=1 Tax=Streptomyces longispororuber TaxID=68230 RepID=UPI0036FBF440
MSNDTEARASRDNDTEARPSRDNDTGLSDHTGLSNHTGLSDPTDPLGPIDRVGGPAPTVWRRRNDSSDLAEPRALLRVYTPTGTLESVTASYERLLGVAKDMWFTYPERGLRLAVVGSFLLVEGAPEVLAPLRATDGTLVVDSAAAYLERLAAEGAEVLVAPHAVPTGTGFTARHRDGTVVEYVEHRPTPDGS